MSTGEVVSISIPSQEDRCPLRSHTRWLLGVAILACQGCCTHTSPPLRPGGALSSLCSWGGKQHVPSTVHIFVFHVSTLHRQEVRQLVTQVSVTGVAKLTIWGPTFTLIGPKVFGKILVGELVLETGNVIIEILPKKTSRKRVLNYFLRNLWITLANSHIILMFWNQVSFFCLILCKHTLTQQPPDLLADVTRTPHKTTPLLFYL